MHDPFCDSPDCTHCRGRLQLHSESMERVKEDPITAIRTVLTALNACDSDNSCLSDEAAALLKALVYLVPDDPRVKKSGALTLFLLHIIKGSKIDLPLFDILDEEYHGTPCHWDLPLRGIVYMLNSISLEARDRTPSDDQILQVLRDEYLDIFVIIWDDFPALLRPGVVGDDLRSTVSQAITAFVKVLDLQTQFRRSKMILAITMQCWLSMSISKKPLMCALSAVHSLLRTSTPLKADPDVLRRVVKSVTIDVIISQIRKALLNEDIIDIALHMELKMLLYLVFTLDLKIVAAFSHVFYDVIVSLKRQLRRSIAPECITLDVFEVGDRIIWIIFMHVDHMKSKILTDEGFLTVAAEGLVISDASHSDDWVMMFEHMVDCVNSLRGPRDPTSNSILSVGPEVIPPMRLAIERLYCYIRYKLIHNLIVNAVAGDPSTLESFALDLWESLALSLNISDSELQIKWREEKQCANPRCINRIKRDAIECLVCSGCGSAWYCDKTCQRLHWKTGHRRQCPRLKQTL